jgi:hypothetical protein
VLHCGVAPLQPRTRQYARNSTSHVSRSAPWERGTAYLVAALEVPRRFSNHVAQIFAKGLTLRWCQSTVEQNLTGLLARGRLSQIPGGVRLRFSRSP